MLGFLLLLISLSLSLSLIGFNLISGRKQKINIVSIGHGYCEICGDVGQQQPSSPSSPWMQTKVSNIASPVGNKRTSPPPLKPVNVQFSLPGHHNWCPGVSFASHSSSGVSRIGGGLLIARTAGQKKFIFSNKKDQ